MISYIAKENICVLFYFDVVKDTHFIPFRLKHIYGLIHAGLLFPTKFLK